MPFSAMPWHGASATCTIMRVVPDQSMRAAALRPPVRSCDTRAQKREYARARVSPDAAPRDDRRAAQRTSGQSKVTPVCALMSRMASSMAEKSLVSGTTCRRGKPSLDSTALPPASGRR